MKRSIQDTETKFDPPIAFGDNATEQHFADIDALPDGWEWPGRGQLLAVMGSVCLAVFVGSLDRTILSTAIPRITDDFHSLDDVGWYASVFLLTSCGLLLTLGRVMTIYSPKWIFVTLLIVFEIGSIVSAAAPNSIAFIWGRAIAGIGGAGIMTGGVVLMAYTVPLENRPKWSACIGASFGTSCVLGPLIGGALTSNVNWRWCFWINLPIGGVSIIAIALVLKSTPVPEKQASRTPMEHFLSLDPLGALCLIPSLVCLILALQWGGAIYPWSDRRIIALMVVFAVLWTAFVVVQVFNKTNATIPRRIVQSRDVWAAILWMFCHGGAMTVIITYLPLYFQAIQGNSAIESGIRTFPLIIALVVGMISGGVITQKTGYYTPVAYVCAVIAPIGCGLLSTLTPTTRSDKWIGYQVFAGYGIGLGFQSAMMAVQTILPHQLVATGIAVIQFSQVLGASVFVAVAQNMLISRLVSELGPLIPNFDAQLLTRIGVTQVRTLVPPESLRLVLDAYMVALKQVFYLSAGLAAALVLPAVSLKWKSVKKAREGDEKRLKKLAENKKPAEQSA